MDTLIGKSLDRYHILEPLGEGGMAVVYKAYDTRLETEVAVKVIRMDALPQNAIERSLKRFEREAKALAKLTHPNIVKVLDYGEQEGKPYLVMPYLPGGTLKQQTGNPMRWDEAIRLLIPIARAVDYAHQQGIVHRDIKPSNILITHSGEPMLTDFGVAKMLQESGETVELTGTGVGIGTPEYMSPEQFQGRGVDARADIYSLGVVLYEMVTGRKPYQADTPAAILIKQATDPLPRPRGFVASLPDAVERILLKALAKKPEDRYQTANAFVLAMEQALQGKKADAEKALPGSKKPLGLILGVCGVIALVFLGIYYLAGLGDNSTAAPATSTLQPTTPLSPSPAVETTPAPANTDTTVPVPTNTSTPVATPTPNDGRVYLANLTPISSKVGYFTLGVGTYTLSEGPFTKGQTIKANGVEYPYGLLAHAPSNLQYYLGKKYSSFLAKIFIDGYDTCSGTAGFIVLLDSREIYRSEALTYKYPTVVPIDIRLDVTGGDVLTLITDPLEGDYCDITFWGDPYLLP